MSQQPPGGPPPGQPVPPAPGGGAPMGGAAQPTDSQGRPLPEGWKRFVSSLIDVALVVVVSYIIQIIFFAGASQTVTVDPETGALVGGGGFLAGTFGVVIVIWVLEFLYFTILNGMEKGQTVGKMIMKIQLRDEATGGPVGMGKAALRTLIMILLSIPCGIPILVSALFPLWDPKRQTLHDKATNTICVEAQ